MADDHYKLLRRLLVMVIINVLRVMKTQQVQCNDDWANLTILDDSAAVSQGAVCLDGGPPGYHFSAGFGEGAKNWMVYLWGGGWCDTTSNCLWRSNSTFGTTKYTNKTILFGGILSQDQQVNPDFYNWNKAAVVYCDGGSFTGDVEEVDPVTKVYYRGARVFKAVIQDLLAKGMKHAENAMLSGTSAGGLATILNCDRFQGFLPIAKRVKCVADSGFFLRGQNRSGAKEREDYYSRIVSLHGIAKNLPASCTSKMDPGLCFFPENLVDDVKTPLFLLNSAFDRYQITNPFQPRVNSGERTHWINCTDDLTMCTKSQIQLMKDFHSTFLETLQGLGKIPSRGEFINSCYIHDYLYSTKRYNVNDSPRVENKTIGEAIGDWYFDRSVVDLVDTVTDCPVNCTLTPGS